MFLRMFLLIGILATSCVSSGRPVILERPERPLVSGAEPIREAVESGDVLALAKLYALDMAALMAYARALEALLEGLERPLERQNE